MKNEGLQYIFLQLNHYGSLGRWDQLCVTVTTTLLQYHHYHQHQYSITTITMTKTLPSQLPPQLPPQHHHNMAFITQAPQHQNYSLRHHFHHFLILFLNFSQNKIFSLRLMFSSSGWIQDSTGTSASLCLLYFINIMTIICTWASTSPSPRVSRQPLGINKTDLHYVIFSLSFTLFFLSQFSRSFVPLVMEHSP